MPEHTPPPATMTSALHRPPEITFFVARLGPATDAKAQATTAQQLLPYLNRFSEYPCTLYTTNSLQAYMDQCTDLQLDTLHTCTPLSFVQDTLPTTMDLDGDEASPKRLIIIALNQTTDPDTDNHPPRQDALTSPAMAQAAQAEVNAMLAYMASCPALTRQVLVVTHPAQLNVLEPDLVIDAGRYEQLCTQLFESLHADDLLLLRRTTPPPECQPEGHPSNLYTTNPGWQDALTFHTQATPNAFTTGHWQNALSATYCWLQLAQAQALSPFQLVLVQQGVPVQVICTDANFEQAFTAMLTTCSPLIMGGTLMVSQPVNESMLAYLKQCGLAQVVCPVWTAELLTDGNLPFLPTTFDVDRLKVGTMMLQPTPGMGVRPVTVADDCRQADWLVGKPTHPQLMDIELGLIISDLLMPASAILVEHQHVMAISQGQGLPSLAIESALNAVAGQTTQAVAVVNGEGLDRLGINALVQGRIKGLLSLSPLALAQRDVLSFGHVDFFMGTYLPKVALSAETEPMGASS
ncbi:MAG: hypothetical protein KC474_05105 [Cyanobacteria bacterium HKST-UBA04]|nr:hypothetical protein [Cyanobacteria bacterium HKST-UBA04]